MADYGFFGRPVHSSSLGASRISHQVITTETLSAVCCSGSSECPQHAGAVTAVAGVGEKFVGTAAEHSVILYAAVAAINALSMVEPSQQWLLQPRPLHQALVTPQTFNPSSQAPNVTATPKTDPSDSTHPALLDRCKKGVAASVVLLSGHSVPGGYNQYTDLTKEHAAAQAHAVLASLEPETAHRPTVPDDVFHRLLAAGKHNKVKLFEAFCVQSVLRTIPRHSVSHIMG